MCQTKSKLTRAQVLDLYKNKFSSTVKPSEFEIEVCIEKGECYNCSIDIKDFYDYPVIYKDKELLCDDCNDELYREFCTTCETMFGDKGKDNNLILAVVEGIPGIYKILQRPFFHGSTLYGFNGFFNERLELLKKVEIKEGEEWGYICNECVKEKT